MIKRRDFVLGSGALSLSGVASAKAVGEWFGSQAVEPDDYFLSPGNPVANRDQRDLEALAIKLFAREDMQGSKKLTADKFALATKGRMSPEVWARFPDWIESYTFRSTLMAVNSDANYPKVLRVYNPAGKWMGNDTPESRWGMENPDVCYRIIPIGFGGQYRVYGQRMANPPSDVSYVLVADTDTSVTIGLIEERNMEIAPDGSFVITLDETPANGRPNHIQVTDEARYLFIRDAMGDWAQTPNALMVERVNAPTRAPLSEDELAHRAWRVMQTGVPPMYYWMNSGFTAPPGTIRKPSLTGPAGGLLTQLSASGWLKLADDEAFVLTVDPLESAYFSMVVYEMWGRTLEYRDHQTSLNNTQMAANADGRFTFVISHRDPGVHNWIQPVGNHELRMTFRWQGISPDAKDAPDIETNAVAFDELASALPAGVPAISAKQREEQFKLRQQLFDRRFIDG